ncbi:MAG: TRAP transporter small permease [Burkholderiaceae bacterium]
MLHTLDAALSRIEETLIGLLLVAASFVLFINVVARYGFNDSLAWAEEITRYAIVWMVFLGGSVAARKGIHIGVDILARSLGDRPARRYLVALVDSLCVAFGVFLVVFGGSLAAQAYEFGQVTPALQVPLWTVQLAIPVGGALMTLRFVQRLRANWTGHAEAVAAEMLG